VKLNLPQYGKVGVLQITDRQFGTMELFYGIKKVRNQRPAQQLELF